MRMQTAVRPFKRRPRRGSTRFRAEPTTYSAGVRTLTDRGVAAGYAVD
jgi:hypothetical protein